MPTTAPAPFERSIFFWGLTLSMLCYSIGMLSFAIYATYQLHFGRGKEVLSEAMGTEAYNNYIAETFGMTVSVLVITTFIILTAALIYLIKKEYKCAKILLLAFIACIAITITANMAKYGDIQTSIGPLFFLYWVIIAALFFYAYRYDRLSKVSI